MKRLAMLLAICTPLGCFAADDGPALLGEFFTSRDSEQFEISSVSGGFAPHYVTQDRLTGIIAREVRFAAPGWARDGEQLALQHRRKYRDGWLHAEIGVTHVGRTSMSGSLTRGWFEESGRSTELFAERNLVESRLGVENNISATLAGVAANFPLSDRVSASTYAAAQYVEDNNWRGHVRLKLSYEFNPASPAVQLQARVRSIRASNPFTGNYFNPKASDEILAGIFARVDHHDWRFSLWAGAGPQRIDSVTHNAYVIETRLIAPRMAEVPVHASITFGLRRDGARDAGYTYRYVSGNIGYRF